jgi:hypothetical protein
MNTYILASYATLQSIGHQDIATIANEVTRQGGTAVQLPSTVIARMTDLQYAGFTMADVPMADDANTLCLHVYRETESKTGI